jgi:hypothetical protein
MLKQSAFTSVVSTVVVDQPSNMKIHNYHLGSWAVCCAVYSLSCDLTTLDYIYRFLYSEARAEGHCRLPETTRVQKARQLENPFQQNTKQRHNN